MRKTASKIPILNFISEKDAMEAGTPRPTIICLTPVKNEAWILQRFLKCTSQWADHIIIADQGSDDCTPEIAKTFPKVRLIKNEASGLDEAQRQALLIDEARKIPGPRILIALDADEFLTPNFASSPEWATVVSSRPGTVIQFLWANIMPDLRHYWIPRLDRPFGFHDDGSFHQGVTIHGNRIPFPPTAPVLSLRDIKVMHYQYTDWGRMESKHRWYQCWERINDTKRSAVDIYRQYHHMYAIPDHDVHPIPSSWLAQYAEMGIDMTTILKDGPYRWDDEIVKWLLQYGPEYFRRESIWNIDWKGVALSRGCTNDEVAKIYDPRNLMLRRVHKWLKQTQPRADRFVIRSLDKFLSRVI